MATASFVNTVQEATYSTCRMICATETPASSSETFMWAVYSQRASVVTLLRARKNRLRHLTDVDFWRRGVHRDIKLENVLIASRGRKTDFQAW